MLSLLVSTILVSVTLAATPCCIDRQFEAVFGEIGGAVYSQTGTPQPALINGQNVIHYDFYTKKMAVESTLFFSNGTNTTSDVVIDYTKNVMYLTQQGHCVQMPNSFTNSFFEPCIPDNAVHIRSSYIGYGTNQIPFTTWQFLQPNTGNVVRMSVTDSGCIPIVESAFGTILQGSTDLVFIITNFRPGIRKSNIFNVPKNCPAIPANNLPSDVRRTVDKLKTLIKF